MLSPFQAPAKRQVSLLFRAAPDRLADLLPDGISPVECGHWGLLELACAVPKTERAGAEVALLAWRIPATDASGVPGAWVLDRWTSARLGSGWPDRWVAQRITGERGVRSAAWEEALDGLSLAVRAGERELGFSSTPVDRPSRSVFVTTGQAERFLAEHGSVINPHPLGRLLERVGLHGGAQALQPLSLHHLKVTPPTGFAVVGTNGEVLDGLELDSAFRLTDRRAIGSNVAERATRSAPVAPLPSAPLASVGSPPRFGGDATS